jgi:hypothetical protein
MNWIRCRACQKRSGASRPFGLVLLVLSSLTRTSLSAKQPQQPAPPSAEDSSDVPSLRVILNDASPRKSFFLTPKRISPPTSANAWKRMIEAEICSGSGRRWKAKPHVLVVCRLTNVAGGLHCRADLADLARFIKF